MLRKLKWTFMKSYLVLLLISVVVMSVISAAGFSMFKRDLLHKNELLLDYIKNSFDTVLAEISKLSYEVGNTSWVVNYTKNRSTQQAVRVTAYLSTLCCVSESVQDISIYYPQVDEIVNSSGRFLTRHHYRLTQRGDDPAAYARFIDQLGKRHTLEFTIEDIVNKAGRSEQVITFYHSLSRTADNGDPLMIVRLDNREIRSMIESVVMNNSDYFAILTPEGNSIAFSGNEQLRAQAESALEGQPTDQAYSISDGALILSHTVSDYMGMRYLSISKEGTFAGVLSATRNMLIAGLAGLALVGWAVSMYFSRRNARPVRALTRAVSGKNLGEPDVDAYAYIERNIERILRENASAAMRLENQHRALKRMFVAEVLRGEAPDEKAFLAQCTACSLDVSGACFAAFALYLSDVPPRVGAREDADDLLILLEESVRALCAQPETACEAELVLLNGIFTGWLILPRGEEAVAIADGFLRALLDGVGEEYGMTLTAARGSLCGESALVAQSAAQARKALQIALTREMKNEVVSYETLTWEEPQARHSSVDLIGRFVNCLKLRDYENALSLSDTLFEGYLGEFLPPNTYEMHMHAVCSVLSDALAEAGAREDETELAQRDMALNASVLPDAFRQAVRDALEALCGLKERQKNARARRNQDELRRFLDEHYTDSEIGLSLLADQFNMNSAYLSKVIKSELGMGILEYVNKLRVEEAKRLLSCEELTVNQIAQRVGYTSDITFIRVFKRLEGTTPGRYRGSQAEEERQ